MEIEIDKRAATQQNKKQQKELNPKSNNIKY